MQSYLRLIFVLGLLCATVRGEGPATQPATAPAAADTEPTLSPAIAAMVSKAVTEQTYFPSSVKGGAFGKKEFEDLSPDGVLVGFRIGVGLFFNNEVIKYLQPIYLTPQGEETGAAIGNQKLVKKYLIAQAPAGYAVGGVEIRGGGGLDAIKIIYMPFNGTRLDPTEKRTTPQIGGPGGSPSALDGDGTPVIGIHGVIDDKGDYLGLGLIFCKQTALVSHH